MAKLICADVREAASRGCGQVACVFDSIRSDVRAGFETLAGGHESEQATPCPRPR